MIERYTRPEMGRIWTQENKYRKWLDVELAVCEARAERGEIPPEAMDEIRRKAAFTVERIDEIERETQHDVIAFLTCVAEHVGPASRFIHEGLTSSDVLDTANALLFKEASKLLLEDMDRLLEVLKRRAFEFKDTVMMGRSHGIHAEPVTFGLKWALWYAEMQRNRARLERAAETMRVGKISGAVGTYANIDPEIERRVCERLGLKPAPISTQVIQRDRYAEFFTTLAIIGASIEKIAVEIRHLQRTEVREAEEYFAPGQKGSSAMPHKRNPIASENLSGLARVLRGNALAAMENVALWHERDISHSSVERIIGPDSTILLDYMLNRLTRVLDKLTAYPENMRRNMEITGGLLYSQRVLLALVGKGLTREDAYRLVQRNAMAVWNEGGHLKERLKADPEVTAHLSESELEGLFDLGYHLKHVDTIFRQVFGE
ncbi:Adenylosuccinate lyase [Desulfacinum infernum DSM 9756]|uniref:Adenylosuccinate lyase n=1 Tax=Desulfacinum infernum DSM 9756 TaxID=1121391 RepID=A0A1M5DP90_9BACT|nr:adenylosuccinate lyase [Desulfacinum infernum]MBC7359930.1 adenylosuccinate lyase [Desulfacinum sp.]SHF68848.1 Adenylosuccinate lyase [Desulfacinum infernum DSM 9756]